MEKVTAINRADLVSLSRLLSSAVVVIGGGDVVLEGWRRWGRADVDSGRRGLGDFLGILIWGLFGHSPTGHDRRLLVVAVVTGGVVLRRQAAARQRFRRPDLAVYWGDI
ncbi:eukaryotic initiation factor 4A [Striga asiatica]|uniref:Eukaryotic initiation factor 4A n=1 Tax=Striga asiatica TaxID=4170 RepID=A0A5A7PXM6_STRAF|nr:eukaryotic initiation factor 4A [Striga asiatica]